MKRIIATLSLLASSALASTATMAQTPPSAPAAAADDEDWPEAWFEVFKLAPGKHEEFMRRIARADEVAKAGGQPPIQIFVHETGADWDVLLYKPVRAVKPTAAQLAAMAAKRKEFGMESGPAYFIKLRETVASHTDSKAYGPLSAGQWLARLDKWRAENPKAGGH
ncbi:MAG: hypothetical protein ACO1O3_15880 [Sphingobium sp.]